jgi:hypothetical protein
MERSLFHLNKWIDFSVGVNRDNVGFKFNDSLYTFLNDFGLGFHGFFEFGVYRAGSLHFF